MTAKKKWGLAVAFIVMTMMLITCKPYQYYYYLGQVCRIHGRVKEEPGGYPVESVEVSIHGYLYSDLTNHRGDYELELPAGTWTIDFARKRQGNGPDGGPDLYKPVSVPVTVGPDDPDVRLDITLTYPDWEGGRMISESDPKLIGNLAIVINFADINNNDWVTLQLTTWDRSTGDPLYSFDGEVLAASESRIDFRISQFSIGEGGVFVQYGPGSEPYDSMMAILAEGKRGDGIDMVYLPYSIAGGHDGPMTVNIPVDGGFEDHVFVR